MESLRYAGREVRLEGAADYVICLRDCDTEIAKCHEDTGGSAMLPLRWETISTHKETGCPIVPRNEAIGQPLQVKRPSAFFSHDGKSLRLFCSCSGV